MSSRRLVVALVVSLAGGAVAAGVIAAGTSSGGHRRFHSSADRRHVAPVRAQAARPTTTSPARHQAPPASPRSSLVARLTPSQLMGQRIIYAYAGPTPPAALLDRIRAGEAGGVIFFGPNVADPSALGAALGELEAANRQSPVHAPLLLMADQEGGLVRRLPGPPDLSEKQIGESNDPAAAATEAGTGAGQTLAGAGLNVNLAPVLDVFRTPGNFIDGLERSYSSDPQVVASLGAHFISAQQQTGVAAGAKHFPGLGAAGAGQNTDDGPVALDVPLAALRDVDELPYRSAIAAGVKLVLVSWGFYPALDLQRPAGLSPAVVDSELRGRLGYHGVVITDALAAGALEAFGTIPNRAVLAAAAGDDLMLCSTINPDLNTPTEGEAALQGLVGALADGQISRGASEQSAARIIALRMSLR